MTDNLEDLRKIDLPFDVDEVEPQCHECVRKQLEKYQNAYDENKESVKGRFIVPCKGIKKQVIDEETKKALSDKQIEELTAIKDVVAFAEKYIKLSTGEPFIARWYQAQILRCTSKRMVLRLGRRCLVPDSMVLMADGNWRKIKDIKVGDSVASRNKKNQLVSKKVDLFYDNGIKDIYNISISNGMSVTCTSNHPLLAIETLESGKGVRKVWKSIEDGLKVGTKVVVMKHYEKWSTEHNPKLGALLGYMLTDCYFGKPGQIPEFTNHSFVELTKSLDLYDIKSNRKTLLENIFNNYDKETIMCLINRMFSGDGGVSIWKKRGKQKGEIFLVSSSKETIRQVQLLLRKIGVESFISLDERDIDILDRWKLRITNADSIENFFSNVGLIYGKEEASQKLLDLQSSITKRRKKESEQFRYETIKSIEPAGQSQTYDIGLEDASEHNFVTDGILVHNTGKTTLVCIQILYNLFTHKNIKIVVVGPQKKHAEEIFRRVKEFIYSNPILSNSIKRDVLSPYAKIELKNGSTLEGFAGGSDSGNKKGVGIRGSDADMIYLEEADYIDEESIRGAVLPILMTTPDVTLTAFSTPSGFKTLYYKWCVQNPLYIEFYHDYKVLPWYKNIEAERSSFTEEEWSHEMLALFSDSSSGVYKKSYIDRALHAYKYEDNHRMPNWVYCMGVDWNEEHGTELVVLGQNKFTNTFKIVDVEHVPKSQFTQLSGIAKLIELNRKWKPNFVYIDRGGGGSTNKEVIIQQAMRERTQDGDRDTARLVDILKKYDSGASIEVKDIYTGQTRKEPRKAFMVNASIRMFEQGLIHISSADKTLEEQLRNYIIARVTPTKVPVYGLADEKVGDHRLDALNLAIVAFHLEFDDLYKTQIVTDMGLVLDPRSLKKEGNKIKQAVSRPESRRINDFELNSVEKQLLRAIPGRIDSPSRRIKTNKPGWDTDREDVEYAKWIQRRRAKSSRRFRDPPKRENI